MSLSSRSWMAAGIAVLAAGLGAAAISQLVDYAQRAALAVRLTHEVGGPAISVGFQASPYQLVLPGLEVAAVVALVGVFAAARISARSERNH